ncbi:MAG: 1,4-dihydroxy-2-naphthoate octaprenyltransferase [Chlamydiota bacterium]|nr:1,4-dihydroxy-2-naphthoate octaprenyltransferase [Chlamydiota bacterium]
MNQITLWIEAARPKTWIASMSPVWIGNAMAFSAGSFSLLTFCLTMGFAFFIQIGTNFANDYLDAKQGCDTQERLGPRRMVSSGLIPMKRMAWATHLMLIRATLFGLFLSWMSTFWLFPGVILTVLLSYGYTWSRFSLATTGWADLMVMLCFGGIATVGSLFVQTGYLSPVAAIAAIGPGAFSTSLLALNNLRDIDQDRQGGRKTLAVRFGPSFVIWEWRILMLMATLTPLFLCEFLHGGVLPILTALPPFALLVFGWRILRRNSASLFQLTGITFLSYTLLFCLSILLG